MTSQGNKPAHSRTEVSFAQVVHETIPNRSSSQLDDQLESDDGYLEQDDEENDRIQMQAGNVDDIIVPDRISQLISRKGADVAMKRKGNRRESMVRDLETGKMGGARAQSAEVSVLADLLPSSQFKQTN